MPSPAPALVLLAAGLGSRFGGPKQLAPIGPAGDALIDYTARDALAAGFGKLVLVTRGEIVDVMEQHVRKRWPADAPVEIVRQDLEAAAAAAARAGRTKPLGTAHAVLTAAAVLDGPFGVANADDLYGPAGFRLLADHLRSGRGHTLVAYHLARTLLGDRPVNRALCRVTDGGRLLGIVEGEVRHDGGRLTWAPLGGSPSETVAMTGDELVSVNLWGFTPDVVPVLAAAFADFAAGDGVLSGAELFLPTVVGEHLSGGLEVTVLATEDSCLGVTHPDDVPLLRETLTAPAW